MEYFEKYTSNTYAGSGNQLFFSTDGEIKCGRIYYKISVGGKYNYSILFSNTIDSTFADGSKSYCNLVCNSWKIFGAKIGRCSEVQQNVVFTDLTFDNKAEKEVAANRAPLIPSQLLWAVPQPRPPLVAFGGTQAFVTRRALDLGFIGSTSTMISSSTSLQLFPE